jgi:hypothetical protein
MPDVYPERGATLQITDTEGGAKVRAIFFNQGPCFALPYGPNSSLAWRRYGGCHDPLRGTSDRQLVEKDIGLATYQDVGNDISKIAATVSWSN